MEHILAHDAEENTSKLNHILKLKFVRQSPNCMVRIKYSSRANTPRHKNSHSPRAGNNIVHNDRVKKRGVYNIATDVIPHTIPNNRALAVVYEGPVIWVHVQREGALCRRVKDSIG